jgi:hypothetical protein
VLEIINYLRGTMPIYLSDKIIEERASFIADVKNINIMSKNSFYKGFLKAFHYYKVNQKPTGFCNRNPGKAFTNYYFGRQSFTKYAENNKSG